jgi:hypothetical protein
MTRWALYQRLGLLSIVVSLATCTAGRSSTSPDPRLGVDTAVAIEPKANSGRIAVETRWEDTLTLTLTRMSILDGYVARFVELHEGLPQRLLDLRAISSEGYAVASTDGWGRPIRYRRNQMQYEFSSAGADAVFGTVDDVLLGTAVGRHVPCYIVPGNNEPRRFGTDDSACSRPGAAHSHEQSPK